MHVAENGLLSLLPQTPWRMLVANPVPMHSLLTAPMVVVIVLGADQVTPRKPACSNSRRNVSMAKRPLVAISEAWSLVFSVDRLDRYRLATPISMTSAMVDAIISSMRVKPRWPGRAAIGCMVGEFKRAPTGR